MKRDLVKKGTTGVGVGYFKAHCLRLCEEVYVQREPLIVTKHGKPIVEVIPSHREAAKVVSPLRGTLLFEKDIISPLSLDWEVLR